MEGHIGQILAQLGWADGTRVPAANAENRALEEQLVKATAARAEAATKAAKASERLTELEKHLSRTKARQSEIQVSYILTTNIVGNFEILNIFLRN